MEEKRYGILTCRLTFCCAGGLADRYAGRRFGHVLPCKARKTAESGISTEGSLLCALCGSLLRFRLLIRKGANLNSRRKCNIAIGDGQIGDRVR